MMKEIIHVLYLDHIQNDKITRAALTPLELTLVDPLTAGLLVQPLFYSHKHGIESESVLAISAKSRQLKSASTLLEK